MLLNVRSAALLGYPFVPGQGHWSLVLDLGPWYLDIVRRSLILGPWSLTTGPQSSFMECPWPGPGWPLAWPWPAAGPWPPLV